MSRADVELGIVLNAIACEQALVLEADAVGHGEFEHAAVMADAAEASSVSAFEWASLL